MKNTVDLVHTTLTFLVENAATLAVRKHGPVGFMFDAGNEYRIHRSQVFGNVMELVPELTELIEAFCAIHAQKITYDKSSRWFTIKK